MELITGYAGEPHIEAGDDAALYKGILSGSDVILDVDDKFAYEVVFNNQIRIKSGSAIFQGRLVRIRKNTYDTLTIESGTQALIRNDLIVIRYTLEDGIERADPVVVKGTPGAIGTDPVIHDTNNIDNGDTICDMPLYRVIVNGLNIESVTPLFRTIPTMDWLESTLNSHNHDGRYYTENEMDAKLAGKSNTGHDHNSTYYTKTEVNNSLAGKSPTTHVHDDRYYTEVETNSLLNGKSNNGHTHDDRYYTEAETNSLLNGKSNTTHTHDERYYTESEINDMLGVKTGSLTINSAGFSLSSGNVHYVGKTVSMNLYVKCYNDVMANQNLLSVGAVSPKPLSNVIFSVIDDAAKRPLAAKLEKNGALGVTGDGLTGERYLVINLTYMSA